MKYQVLSSLKSKKKIRMLSAAVLHTCSALWVKGKNAGDLSKEMIFLISSQKYVVVLIGFVHIYCSEITLFCKKKKKKQYFLVF